MASLFSSPKTPSYVAPVTPARTPETPPPPITKKAKKSLSKRKGDRANLFTGGEGLGAANKGNLSRALLRNKLGVGG